MTVAQGGGIFVSYRRQESRDFAGRLYDRLADRFGEGEVFIDVDTIEPGVDFAEEIFRAVAACQVLLAVIGPNWLTATDERGGRRLDDPDDIVRLEIQAALARGVRVIPILVEGAVMPGRQDLPETIAGLARRNALLIRHESFRYDAGRLVTAIERILAPATGIAVVPGLPNAHGVRSAGDASGEETQKGSGPSRHHLARAGRFFADAERIARSITDEPTRASALSGIAATLAATDPDRAARLFADAERIARSITDEPTRASALSGIAATLAATDPDHAERIANSIRDEPSKAWPLRAVAKALAAADPDRAERIANSIPSEFSKASALRDVAAALAATDPDRAERIARSITNEFFKVWALSDVAKALAAADPNRAARLFADAEGTARSITEPTSASALRGVAEALAATEPDRAERIARSISWVSKASALRGIAATLAATDPDRAERIANSIGDESSKTSALSDIAKALAATDPDRADRLFADAERIAKSIRDESSKASALSDVAKALAATSS
jgi:hypothetical protein